jgi:UDP-N-acetyl-D-mannosaminuronic acid dehydrogenase
VLKKVQRVLGSLQGKKIAALGLAYKADVDDLRESPAAEVARLIQQAGANVKAWEPFKPNAQIPDIHATASLEEAIEDADALLLLVKHTEFSKLDPQEILSKTTARIVIDVVNGWDRTQWEGAGFQVFRLGVHS